MSLDTICDELLPKFASHNYGIPALWVRNPEKTQPELEKSYYDQNGKLATHLDKLVYLNKMQRLRQLDVSTINDQYLEFLGEEIVKELEEQQLELFLVNHLTAVKTHALLRDYLPLALPVLRAIHIDNASLTESELLILNNLKKLYSRYNEHPANIRWLMNEYERSTQLLEKRLNLMAQIQESLETELAPKIRRLNAYNKEIQQLKHLSKEGSLTATEIIDATTNLRHQLKTLLQLLQKISVLCDLIPALVLCHPSNWYNDKSLREIMEKGQDVAETIPDFSAFENIDDLDLHQMLLLDSKTFMLSQERHQKSHHHA